MEERLKHLYFASCAQDGGIYHFQLLDDRFLSFCEKTSIDRPMYIIQEADRLFVLLRSPFGKTKESGLISFPIEEEGRLGNASSVISTKGEVACHLCSFEGQTYAVNYASGSLFSTGGNLVVRHYGHGIDPKRQQDAHPHMVTPTPDGKFLMCTDLGLDRIFIYDKFLQELSNVSSPAGNGPRHLCVLDCGHVACSDELSCTVSVYAYHQGVLEHEASLPLFEEAKTKGATPAAIRLWNEHVYISVRGADVIVVFRWNQGKLEKVQTKSCEGKSPRDILIVDGILLCMNETSSTVTMFQLNGKGFIGNKIGNDLQIANVLCAVQGS
ncbi:MAG: beta-propeller fold lactonase family protein [Sphaerochaetaceae bacterium]